MDVREKLVEMSEQLRYCADVSDCANCKRWDKVCENQCVDNLLLMAADLIDEVANGVTVQEWIPVGDSPKERGVYIVTVKHWLDGKPVTREAKWNGADWLSCYKAEEITPRVTHWLPLPQPPKGE